MRNATGGWTTITRALTFALCAVVMGCSGGGGGDDGGSTCDPSAVTVAIEPGAATVVANTTQPFVASVTGDADTSVVWTVEEGAVGGEITNTGVYTAPDTPGTYHVIATSQAASCVSATVEVTVEQADPITVSISESGPVTVVVQGSHTFLASVTGTKNTAVVWSVQGGGAGGKINEITGVYVAPSALGATTVDVVIATSAVDASASDQVVVNVIASATATISPSEVTVPLGGRVQFSLSAVVGGTWSLNGDATIGAITFGDGLYTAPIQMPTPTSAIEVSHTDANEAVVTLITRFSDPETLQVDACVPQCQVDQPNAIVSGDFNGDDLDDLATANSRTGTVSVLVAADAAHFAAPYRLQVGDPDSGDPQALALVDINLDSTPQNPRVDLVMADADPAGLAVRTRLGLGDGTFGNERESSLPSNSDPLSMAVGYFDSDPDLDVAVANFSDSTVHILRGGGDGTFSAIPTSTYGPADGVSGPLSITAADFNRDSFDDFAVANRNGDTVLVFLSQGDGTFAIQSLALDPSSGPSAVAAANIDAGNYPDLLVTTAENNQLTVFLNMEDPGPLANPRFDVPNPAQYPVSTGSLPIAVAVGDFNKDGSLDVAVANQGDDSVTTYLFDPGDGDKLVQSETYVVGDAPQSLAVGDFNGDGWPDIAVANSEDDTVSVLRNRGRPTAP